jgi:hypothetical protein
MNESKQKTISLMSQIQNHPSLFCLFMTPEQISILLEHLADQVEHRGDIGHDLDPGETADWLRNEARFAKNCAKSRKP